MDPIETTFFERKLVHPPNFFEDDEKCDEIGAISPRSKPKTTVSSKHDSPNSLRSHVLTPPPSLLFFPDRFGRSFCNLLLCGSKFRWVDPLPGFAYGALLSETDSTAVF